MPVHLALISPTSCRLRHCFDLTASSSHLAPVAGVLTALTFSSIIYLANRDTPKTDKTRDSLLLLCTAFVALMLATFLYAENAAEELPAGRASFDKYCTSIIFAV